MSVCYKELENEDLSKLNLKISKELEKKPKKDVRYCTNRHVMDELLVSPYGNLGVRCSECNKKIDCQEGFFHCQISGCEEDYHKTCTKFTDGKKSDLEKLMIKGLMKKQKQDKLLEKMKPIIEFGGRDAYIKAVRISSNGELKANGGRYLEREMTDEHIEE